MIRPAPTVEHLRAFARPEPQPLVFADLPDNQAQRSLGLVGLAQADELKAQQRPVVVGLAVAELRVGGLGIYLMRSLMDEVDYEIKPGVKNKVTMVKYFMNENKVTKTATGSK